MKPAVSVVLPVYNEGENVTPVLDRIFDVVATPCEVVAVYDSVDDTTAPVLAQYAAHEPRLRPTLNRYGRGPALAIRAGFEMADAEVVVVTMADGSDDVSQIDEMARRIRRGAVIVAASRYVRGGRQVGGPLAKGLLSRLAGLSLYHLARIGTHDPTSAFKAYSASFVREVGVSSDAGFEMALELVAKAKRRGLPVTEIPTVWRDREHGRSNFKLLRWVPRYMHWYWYAFGFGRAPTRGSSL